MAGLSRKIPPIDHLLTAFPELKIHDVTEMPTSSGGTHIVDTIRWERQKAAKAKVLTNYPLTIRRRATKDGTAVSLKLEIKSHHIIHGLREIFRDYEGISSFTSPMIFQPPFYPLVHRFDAIWRYTYDQGRLEEEQSDLEHLLQFICLELRNKIRSFRKVKESHKTSSGLLWTLFEPGSIIFHNHDRYTECYNLQSIGYDGEGNFAMSGMISHMMYSNSIINNQSYLALQWNYASGNFGYSKVRILINKFDGERDLFELNCLPLNLARNPDGIRAFCISQGQLWRRVIGRCYCQYNATASATENQQSIYSVSAYTSDAEKPVHVRLTLRVLIESGG